VKLDSPPLALWVPLASGVALGVPALIAVLTHRLILFASLAPTSVMIAQQPLLSSTRPYNTIVGHMIGLGAGFFSVWALGIAAEPSVFAVHAVSGGRACASVLAIVIAAALEILLEAQHPPGAATTLLAALGSFRVDWRDTWQVFIGVVAVTLAGELLQKLHPAPPTPAVRASAARRSGASAGGERR
jgi:CBS-domain-containing membrane protein